MTSARLRRIDLPLETAARLASWCHTGHCDQTTADLPALLADKRREIAARVDDLHALDQRLAQLERHLGVATPTQRRALLVLTGATPCCDAAAAVSSGEGEACAVCSA